MSIQDNLSENTAAISGTLHQHPQYEILYESTKDELGGFPGIWKLCADVATAFTVAEFKWRQIAGETYDWIEAVDEIVERVIDICINGNGPQSVSWLDESSSAISSNSY